MTDWTSDERRARWERSVATKEAAGFPVERDPRFLAWIEDWIAGEITMPEVQRRYADWMSTRGAIANREIHDTEMQTILEAIRHDVPEIAGVPLTTAEDRAQRAKEISHIWELDEQ